MGIFKLSKALISLFCLSFTGSDMLDHWIRDALWEDATAPLPVGTWERLRKAIVDHQQIRKNYGMWILDEPLRDPPSSLPTTLTGRQLERAMRIYTDSKEENVRLAMRMKSDLWSNLVPTFSAVVNI